MRAYISIKKEFTKEYSKSIESIFDDTSDEMETSKSYNEGKLLRGAYVLFDSSDIIGAFDYLTNLASEMILYYKIK